MLSQHLQSFSVFAFLLSYPHQPVGQGFDACWYWKLCLADVSWFCLSLWLPICVHMASLPLPSCTQQRELPLQSKSCSLTRAVAQRGKIALCFPEIQSSASAAGSDLCLKEEAAPFQFTEHFTALSEMGLRPAQFIWCPRGE